VRPTKRSLGVTAIILAAAGAATYGVYRRDLDAAFERIAHSSGVVETQCGSIEYATAGTGPPVLVVHGAGGGFDQGLAIGAPLAARGYRVIAMSRFGYLRTPLPAEASAAAQGDAHACLLDALGLTRAAVVAASAGAPSALQLALRHPTRVSALVLLVPATFVPRPDNAPPVRTPPGTQRLFDTALRVDFAFWVVRRAAPATMTRALLATPPDLVARATEAERARMEGILDGILPVSARRLGLLNDAHVTSHLERYALERVDAPTLAISVADDLYGTYEAARYTAEQVPNGRFVGYADGGHVFVGREAEVMSEIDAFLRPM
jgi:pimeloyl-ACP methyl ester carboxylesterase